MQAKNSEKFLSNRDILTILLNGKEALEAETIVEETVLMRASDPAPGLRDDLRLAGLRQRRRISEAELLPQCSRDRRREFPPLQWFLHVY
jgi:hypothetical protein